MILADFSNGPAPPPRPLSLDERRADRGPVLDPPQLEQLVRSGRSSCDPEKRALALALARQLSAQNDDLRSLEELRSKGAQFRAIFDNLLTALIAVDERGLIQELNPAGERMYGYAAAELKGHPVSILMPCESHGKAMALLYQTYCGGKNAPVELVGRRKNGQLFPCELSMFEIAGGRGRRFAGNIRDLTDKKAVQRLQTDLVSIVSHELRTPLTSIRGSLALIGTGIFGQVPEEAAELVGIAERNCNRLIQLVSDMLDLERLENSELELEKSSVPLAAVIERGLEGVRGFAADQGIALEVAASGGVVWAHSGLLVQVVVNLLSNAIKFSPPGGRVTISTVERRNAVELRVADQGRGIPSLFLRSIFERFGQVQTSDAREKGGTGLGLAICKSIIAKHAGQIGVESEEGKGSIFFFWIPKPPTADGDPDPLLLQGNEA